MIRRESIDLSVSHNVPAEFVPIEFNFVSISEFFDISSDETFVIFSTSAAVINHSLVRTGEFIRAFIDFSISSGVL